MSFIKHKILLPSSRFLDALDEDIYINLQFANCKFNTKDENQGDILSQEQQYNDEKALSERYRVHGTVHPISLLNNKTKNITDTKDFFLDVTGDTINFKDSFDLYLCLYEDTIPDGLNFRNRYRIISEKNDYDTYKSGYSTNLFLDEVFSFNFDIDVELTGNTVPNSQTGGTNSMYIFFNNDPAGTTYNIDDILNGELVDGNGNVVDNESLYDEITYTNITSDRPLPIISPDNYTFLTRKLHELVIREFDEIDNTFIRKDFMFVNGTHYVFETIVHDTISKNISSNNNLFSNFKLDFSNIQILEEDTLPDNPC